MKFTRANIYGFGKWVDKEIIFNHEKLNVIYGENESGKTTLQQFMMFILFGLTPKEQTFYQPIESSKFGGLLTFLDDEDKEVTVERTHDLLTIYTQKETSNKEEVLASYLKGLTKQTFMSIYSFSAIDLLHIRNITEQEFGNILFNVGLAGATNIEIAERNIERETGKIFKKGGSVPQLNKELKKLEELAALERKLKSQESQYATIKSEQESAKKALADLMEKIEQARMKSDQYRKQLHLLPSINELKSSKEALEKLPNQEAFPESGINRLEKNKKALVPLLSNQANIEKNLLTYQNELDKLKASILSNETYALANELLAERSNYEHNLATSEEYTRDIEQASTEIDTVLKELSIPLNREMFKELTLPYYLTKTWKALEEEAYQLKEVKKEIEAEHTLIENDLKTIEENIQQLKQKQLPFSETDRLKEQLFNYSHVSKQTDHLNKQQNNKKMKKKIIFASAGILSMLIILSLLTRNSFIINSTIILSFVFVGLYFVNNYFEKQNQALIDSLVTKQGDLLSKNEYMNVKNLVDKQEDYQVQLKYLENDRQKISRKELQISERYQMFVQRQEIFDQRVLDERKEYEFLEAIDPIHWSELLIALKKLKERENYLEEKEMKNQHLVEILNGYEIKLTKILDRLSLTNYEQLTSHIEAHKKAEQTIQHYEKIMSDSRDELALLTEEINHYQAEITALFDLASVKTEEEFHRTYYESVERKRLIDQVENYYTQLKTSFDIETIEYLLTVNQDEYDLNQKIIQYKDDIINLDQAIDEERKKIATLNADIKQREETEAYSDVLHKLSYKKTKAKEMAFEWAAMKLATQTLEETKRSFHQKYMKDVIKKASEYFKLITKDKYVAIYPPEKNKTFSVETHLRTRFTINQLSQGTIDQLYVSLRIAISTVMSEKYSVPFIIDDAFVHFDHKREQAVMRLLEAITQEQQVILFTCKKHLLDFTDVTIHYLSDDEM